MSQGTWVDAYFGPNSFQAAVDFDLTSRYSTGKIKAELFGIQCLKCQTVTAFETCSNCSNDSYKFGFNRDDVLGLFCGKCNRGFTSITCKCGTANPVAFETLVKQKTGGCFIVTAAFENIHDPEVLFFFSFRDEVLNKSTIGKRFIQFYGFVA
jgi:hypothetical protein